MNKTELDEFKKDMALFIEAGFVAVKQFDEVNAIRLFKAAQTLQPESTAPLMGMAYIALNKLEVKEAVKIYESILKKEPENYLALTFLGICFLLMPQKRDKGEELIKEAMQKTNDETVKNLGKVALEWLEKDLRKTESPLTALKGKAEKTK